MTSRLRRLRALVLYHSPLREKDRIVEVYSREEGRLRLFAPGVRHVRSRRAGHLEPLCETLLVVAPSRRGDVVHDARMVESFLELRENLERLHVAYDVLQSLHEHTGEGVPDPFLYDAIRSILGALAAPGVSSWLRESAQVHLLRSLGALPDLYRCTRCRQRLLPDSFIFQSSTRGFWCETCAGRRDPFLTDVVKVLRLFLHEPVPSNAVVLSLAVHRRLRTILHALQRSHAEVKSVPFPHA